VAKPPSIRRKGGSGGAGKEAAAVVAAAGAAVVGGKLAWDKLASGSRDQRAFRLFNGELVPDGIRRIARGQLDALSEELAEASKRSIGDAVHDTRKRLKRLRANLRLVRDAVGDEVYRKENATFRRAGRRLSGVRDAKVLVDTLDALAERFRDELAAEAISKLRSQLVAEHKSALESLRADPAVVEGVLTRLKTARRRTAGWTFETEGFAALAPGLRRIYRRGRRLMRAAAAEPTNENLHEWRKRTKDLWHVLQIVRPAAPKRAKKLAKRAHALSDLLGEDHDLAVLRDYIEAHPGLFGDDAARAALLALLDRRRGSLQRAAFELGRSLYKQPPKRFVRRLERGWEKRMPERPGHAVA
jgi:CHAD domain-containing protein